METRQLIVNNVLLTYHTNHIENSPYTLLFLHGWRSESSVWFEIMKKMGDSGYSSIALDLPGFGKSQIPTEIYNTNSYSDSVLEFIKKLEMKNIIGIGHSYGGRTLISLTLKEPKLLSKLVLVNSSGLEIQAQKKNLLKLGAKIVKPLFKPRFMRGLRSKIYKLIGAEDYIASENSNFFGETYLNVIQDDFTEELSLIKVPTLIIWGENDKDTPPKMASIMNKKIKYSKLEIIKGAGHYSFLENKDEFINYLTEFIEK